MVISSDRWISKHSVRHNDDGTVDTILLDSTTFGLRDLLRGFKDQTGVTEILFVLVFE